MNEKQLQEQIANFPYPPTPDLAAGVRRRLAAPTKQSRQLITRRLAWAMVLLFALFAISLAVPQVRAAVLRIFRVGGVTIVVPEEGVEETAVPQVTATTPPQTTLAQDILLSPTGKTTLADVQTQTDTPLFIPEGWGPPDQVYHQTHDWPGVVIFVWLESGSENRARLSLYQINSPNFLYKQAGNMQEITLQGQRAFWLEGGHWLQLQDDTVQPWLFVEGSVLLWWSETADMTFRLESGLSLAEATVIAESLTPLRPIK